MSMEHENAFSTGPVRCVSASTYLRLRFLDSHTVAQEVSRADLRAYTGAAGLVWPGLWPAVAACRRAHRCVDCMQPNVPLRSSHRCALAAAPRAVTSAAAQPSTAYPRLARPLPQLGAHLSRSEQRQLLHRRDYILHYLDGLCASQGYAATVRE